MPVIQCVMWVLLAIVVFMRVLCFAQVRTTDGGSSVRSDGEDGWEKETVLPPSRVPKAASCTKDATSVRRFAAALSRMGMLPKCGPRTTDGGSSVRSDGEDGREKETVLPPSRGAEGCELHQGFDKRSPLCVCEVARALSLEASQRMRLRERSPWRHYDASVCESALLGGISK